MLDEIIASQSGFYESSTSSSSSDSNSALDKDDFLQLLVTQLQNQDPLNPLDDKEFIAQLAQFSSLEQMNNIATGLDTLNETVSKQDALSASNYIGTYVAADGNTVSKLDDGITPLYFTLNDDAVSVTISVYDKNGNIVSSEVLDAMQEGEYTFSWDGLNYNGDEVANGQYDVYFAALKDDDSSVLVDTEVTGQIIGITKGDDGVEFTLNDGRSVSFDDITMLTQLTSSSSDSDSTSETIAESSSESSSE